MGAKSTKRTVGDIVKIPLGDGWQCYARVLPEAALAFYDSRNNRDLPIEKVIERPVLFVVPVMHHAIKGGRWPVIGHIPLDDQVKSPPRFIQDPLDKNIFRIYENGKMRPATREECVGLERAAVWEPEHVEDRLRDHYAGRKNKWFESLKMVD
jgi:hypothetical protein